MIWAILKNAWRMRKRTVEQRWPLLAFEIYFLIFILIIAAPATVFMFATGIVDPVGALSASMIVAMSLHWLVPLAKQLLKPEHRCRRDVCNSRWVGKGQHSKVHKVGGEDGMWLIRHVDTAQCYACNYAWVVDLSTEKSSPEQRKEAERLRREAFKDALAMGPG